MYYLVGSKAVGFYNQSYLDGRNTKDTDLFCTKQEFIDLVKHISKVYKLSKLEFTSERHAYAKFKDADDFFVVDVSFLDVEGQHYQTDSMLAKTGFMAGAFNFQIHKGVFMSTKIAYARTVYLMKMSHRYKKDSPHFNKTRTDIRYFENHYEFNLKVLTPQESTILALREKETYTNKLPNLNQGKSNFFDKSVNYVYDHDTIHTAVKHLAQPAYTYYIKDGSEVFCSKEKFFNLPEIVRLYGVLEESYVLALERAVIPHGTDPLRAFTIALEKVCTSVTSGWFREFAYDNYDKVFSMYHESYVDKFNAALHNGDIKLHGN